MSVKLNREKHLLFEDYVYIIIIQYNNTEMDYNNLIFGVIKCFLQFFKIQNIKSYLKSTIISGEFKDRGIIYYWLKGKCKVLYINTLQDSVIETIYTRSQDEEIPVYKVIDPNIKTPHFACIGPFWTNKLARIHTKLEEEFLKCVK